LPPGGRRLGPGEKLRVFARAERKLWLCLLFSFAFCTHLGRNALKSGDQTGIIEILEEPFRAPGSAVSRPAAADMQTQKQK
jgi:hypothetical protein